jgi:lantibiotic modifying enzyme
VTARLLIGAEAPFADAFAPAVAAAAAGLRFGPGRAVDGDAAAGLVRGVANELACLAAPTLLQQFSGAAPRTSIRTDTNVDVTTFSRWLAAGGLAEIVTQRPDLDRILRRQLSAAVARVGELLDRLEEHCSELERVLGFRLPATDVAPLVNGAYILADGSGHRIVYKRRPLNMEAALSLLTRHVNDRGWGPALPTAIVVDLGDDGFMEHVQTRPPLSPSDVHLMCQRFGMLLAIATLLGAADLHGRNIIVGTDGPVIVDAEVLLRPPWSDDDRAASVHASAILPMTDFVHQAGLLAAFLPPAPSPWCDVGTDAVRSRPMTPTRSTAHDAAMAHLRQLGNDGLRHVLVGFRSAYEGIIAEGLPLEVFADARPRVLLRPSATYEDIMLSSLSPTILGQPGRRATVLERSLAATPPPLESNPRLAASVRRAECCSLDRFLFPRFTMPATGGSLSIGPQRLGRAPFEAPLVRARRLVAAAARDSLERHATDVAQQLRALIDDRQRSSPKAP